MVNSILSIIIMVYSLYKLGSEIDKSCTRMSVVLPIAFIIIMDLAYMIAIFASGIFG